jgi:predicted RNA-binding protein YlxR (DUF448 family)
MLAEMDIPEIDAGARDRAAESERLCLVDRAVKPSAELIRFVLAPQGIVVPDLKRRLPGRGAWVTASRGAVREAVKRRVFARAFRRDVTVPEDLPVQVESLLERFALDALAMTGKAGCVVTGAAKVDAALARDAVRALIHASDASPEGVRKIAAAARRRFGEGVDVIDAFTSSQLGLALGRPNVIHAAVLAGPASSRFLARCRSLDRYRRADVAGSA